MHPIKHTIYSIIILLLALIPGTARGFELSEYAESSLLSGERGPVVRISVESEGLYILTPSRLRSLGFTDPSKVRVYGYGAQRIPDALTTANYVDDLPEVYSEYVEGRGVVFYAVGSGTWSTATGEYMRYTINPYTERSHYFIAQAAAGDESPSAEKIGNGDAGSNPATTFLDRLHHEKELTSPGEAGALLVGENFRNSLSQNFRFTLTDPAQDSDDAPGGWLECSFIANMSTSGSRLQFTVNGTTLESNSTDAIYLTANDQHYHGTETTARHTFRLPEGKTELTVGVRLNATSVIRLANLNYISVNYRRKLRLPSSGYLCFQSSSSGAILAEASADTRVWDVTMPSKVMVLNAAASSQGGVQWSTPYNSMRRYAAWRPGASLPEPVDFQTVEPQNLHAPLAEYPHMIIITPPAYRSAAQKLAELHAHDGLKVDIIDPESIYNEFSSGAAEPGGIRRYLKMMLDRSRAANPEAPLQYAMLFTRPTFDPRHLTTTMAESGYPTIPSWMPAANRASLSDTEGYTTDDFYALLEDGSGLRPGLDELSIAVGRVPVTNATQAQSIVDKMVEYRTKARTGLWRHRFLFTADDEDNGIHLSQTETQIRGITETAQNQHFIRKLYLDSYPRVGTKYPAAHDDLFRYLEEGVVWWNFIGHANTTSWTGNGLLTFSDMQTMYLRHWPFLYTATCDFLRWDSNSTSGGEYIFMERHGGGIGAVSAVRPVYISENGMLSEAMGRAMAQRDDRGRLLPPGEIYRRAKNDIRNAGGNHTESTNRLRYVFMGDPALRLAIPDNIIVIDLPENEEDLVLAAGSPFELSGRITDPITGETLTDFNGTLSAELYDAEQSVTTNGWGEGAVKIYDDYGTLLSTSATTVKDGVFKLSVAMPEVIAQNYRPATLSLYASTAADSEGFRREAAGLFRDLYAYGETTDGEGDTEAPRINVLALNHSSFTNGSIVNPTPAIIAELSDNVGINVSNTGIGRQMNAVLDGTKVYSRLYLGYTPRSDGEPGGSLVYTLDEIEQGAHSLTLNVWDTSGNQATRTIDFYVEKDKAPVIYDVYTDTNPASTVANFYISHDRPEAMATVTVTVYNLLGKALWSGSAQGPSDMFESVPVTWNLCDSSGRRVPRGIYVYRATISSDGESYETASRRIAVTGE